LRGEYILHYIHQLEKTQWLSHDVMENMQWQKLLKLIQYATDYSPFYKSLYQKHNVQIDKIRHKDDLLRLPQLTKDDLRYHQQEMLIPHAGRRLSKKTTGGSTGQAVTILKERRAMASQDAAMWRCLRWFDIDIGDKQARFWGIPISSGTRYKNRMIDLLMNRIRLSAFNFDDQSMKRFVDQVQYFKPKYFYGYVSMLKEFAQFCERNEIHVADFGVKAVVTTSEPLFRETRQYLNNVFQCPVINDYGCGEVGPIAYDCPEGGFHLMADNLYIEILNDQGTHARNGETGEIVVTELNNYSLPLIRYNLKDIAEVTGEKCSCGRGLPLIRNVTGRALDVLIARNGEKVHGEYFNYIAEEIKRRRLGLKQYQIIQKDPKILEVRIVKDTYYTETTQAYIDNKIKNKLGRDITITYTFVDKISREPSGKLRLVKNEIP